MSGKQEKLKERLRELALERIKENERKPTIEAIKGLPAERNTPTEPGAIRGLK